MDVLRENIGLLQLPYEDEYLNEGFLGFGKKKSRWQRFKDAIKNNRGKIAAGAGLLGGATGALIGKEYLYHRRKVNHLKNIGFTKNTDGSYSRIRDYGNNQKEIQTTKPKFDLSRAFSLHPFADGHDDITYKVRSDYYENGRHVDSKIRNKLILPAPYKGS